MTDCEVIVATDDILVSILHYPMISLALVLFCEGVNRVDEKNGTPLIDKYLGSKQMVEYLCD